MKTASFYVAVMKDLMECIESSSMVSEDVARDLRGAWKNALEELSGVSLSPSREMHTQASSLHLLYHPSLFTSDALPLTSDLSGVDTVRLGVDDSMVASTAGKSGKRVSSSRKGDAHHRTSTVRPRKKSKSGYVYIKPSDIGKPPSFMPPPTLWVVENSGKTGGASSSSQSIPQVDGLDDGDEEEDEELRLPGSSELSSEDYDEVPETSNYMRCKYDRVSKFNQKDSRRCVLRYGVMNVNGKEYFFNKALGEMKRF